MITYNDIYEALRKERYSEKLQFLPKGFILSVVNYLEEKKKMISQENELFSEEMIKIKKQIENARAIFDELILLRKKKLLGLVFVASETGISNSDFENMIELEKELFNEMVNLMKNSERKLFSQFNNNSSAEKELMILSFFEDIEELVAPDGSSIGPFSKGEIATLPSDLAEIFISDKKAELVGGD